MTRDSSVKKKRKKKESKNENNGLKTCVPLRSSVFTFVLNIYLYCYRRYDQYRSDQITSLYKAIGMSINSLTPELKELYQTLALFMNDVNIKPEVSAITMNYGSDCIYSVHRG